MHSPQHILNLSIFRRVLAGYAHAFAKAYRQYDGLPEEAYTSNHQQYLRILGGNYDAIYNSAAHRINKYVNLYKIRFKMPDEYKAIFHLGIAIWHHLDREGLKDVAKVHLVAMVGLLDFRLRTLDPPIHKPQLVRAMLTLIRQDSLFTEMGETGLYLTYKCVSTTPENCRTGGLD